jgi:hypothetical protein
MQLRPRMSAKHQGFSGTERDITVVVAKLLAS